MPENWFDMMNAYVQFHPEWVGRLAFLLRLKCWLLTALMAYFLYLIYKEPPQPLPQRSWLPEKKQAQAKGYFLG
jgi:hypothetical protein